MRLDGANQILYFKTKYESWNCSFPLSLSFSSLTLLLPSLSLSTRPNSLLVSQPSYLSSVTLPSSPVGEIEYVREKRIQSPDQKKGHRRRRKKKIQEEDRNKGRTLKWLLQQIRARGRKRGRERHLKYIGRPFSSPLFTRNPRPSPPAP